MEEIASSIRNTSCIIPASCFRLEIFIDIADYNFLLMAIERHCAHRATCSVRLSVPTGFTTIFAAFGQGSIYACGLVFVLQSPLFDVYQEIFDRSCASASTAYDHTLVILVRPPTLSVFPISEQGEGTAAINEPV